MRCFLNKFGFVCRESARGRHERVVSDTLGRENNFQTWNETMKIARNISLCIALLGTLHCSLGSNVEMSDPTIDAGTSLTLMKTKMHRWSVDKLENPILEGEKIENPILSPIQL